MRFSTTLQGCSYHLKVLVAVLTVQTIYSGMIATLAFIATPVFSNQNPTTPISFFYLFFLFLQIQPLQLTDPCQPSQTGGRVLHKWDFSVWGGQGNAWVDSGELLYLPDLV